MIRYEYRTADALVKDFELMKSNAIKFNGQQNQIAEEAIAMYQFVKDQVEACLSEFGPLEEAVGHLMSGKTKKKKKTKGMTKRSSSSSGNMASGGGAAVNIGDLSQSMQFDGGSDSDSDDSIGDLGL
jgi:hypothetical protein